MIQAYHLRHGVEEQYVLPFFRDRYGSLLFYNR